MFDFKGKNVLVTGGCGFIGTNLVNELVKLKAKVTVIDLPEGHWERIPAGVAKIKADILDAHALKGTCKDMDIVYHLAAKADLNGNSLEDYKANFEGTKNLLNEIQTSKNKPQFVYYSTQLVVGLFNEKRFIGPDEPYRTKTFYGESKIAGEKIVKSLAPKKGIPFTIIRPTSVYGPWGGTPYKEFFQTIKAKKYFHVGKADNLVSWAYVKNLVELTLLVSSKKEAYGHIYFGNDFHPYTMRQIVDAVGDYYSFKVPTIPNVIITPLAYFLGIFKALGLNVPIYPFRLKNIKANYCYDIQNAIELGYRPRYGLKAGIKETLDWYEAKQFIV